MTHGCIVVRRSDEKAKRSVLLHTYHSGYLIPDIVKAIPAFICKHRWSFILERPHPREYDSMDGLKDHLGHLGFDEGMYYQLTVAALLVAQSPYMLEVVPTEFIKDHWANTSGHHTLMINENAHKWTLLDEDAEEIASFNPTEKMYEWLWSRIQSQKKAKKKKDKKSVQSVPHRTRLQ